MWGHNQKDFQLTADKQYMEEADANMEEFDKMIKEIQGDLTGRGDQKGADIVAALDKDADEWMKAFDEYVEQSEQNEKVGQQLEDLGEELFALLEKGMEEVIDPAKEKAEQEQNIESIVEWGNIDMEMNESVIAHVLELQVQTVY